MNNNLSTHNLCSLQKKDWKAEKLQEIQEQHGKDDIEASSTKKHQRSSFAAEENPQLILSFLKQSLKEVCQDEQLYDV